MMFLNLLGTILVVLKLMGQIHLSWGWVLLPFLPYALSLAIATVLIVLLFIVRLME